MGPLVYEGEEKKPLTTWVTPGSRTKCTEFYLLRRSIIEANSQGNGQNQS